MMIYCIQSSNTLIALLTDSPQDAVDKIESALASAAVEFDPAELERGYSEAWEAACMVLRPVHPARFKVRTYLPQNVSWRQYHTMRTDTHTHSHS